jgi:hypothetical protein
VLVQDILLKRLEDQRCFGEQPNQDLLLHP